MSVEKQIEPSPFLFVEANDHEAIASAEQILHEGQWHDLDKGWRCRTDGPHTTGMKLHQHIYFKKKEKAVVNKDGTASHNSDLSVLPNWVIAAMKNQNLLESLTVVRFVDGQILVPAEIMEAAFAKAKALGQSTRLMEKFGGR